MQVVFPMAGSGRRFQAAGFSGPKPLVPVGGEAMIARLLRRFPPQWRFVFLCREEDLAAGALAQVLRAAAPAASLVAVPGHRLGPVHTLNAAAGAIADDLPTLVNYCDFDFLWEPDAFEAFVHRQDCDGAVLCYRGFHPHHRGSARYAYCRTEGPQIVEVREKRAFTARPREEFASSGSYYFRSGALLKDYCRRAEAENTPVQGEFYVSEVYNLMLRDARRVAVWEIPFFCQWGTPEDLADYLYWERAFAPEPPSSPCDGDGPRPRLLMPMAGKGLRFSGVPGPLKPLRDVLGRPMFRAALEHLPCAGEDAVLVAPQAIAGAIEAAAPKAQVLALERATGGQAETCWLARGVIDPEAPLLVSACDHGLRWDELAWRRLLGQGTEVVVLGQRGYPGARQAPEAYSYIAADADGGVRRVSVKSPLSPRPEQDLLLVGTFYFSRAAFLFEAVSALLASDRRVRGEWHLDDAVNLCVEQGRQVRVFETDAYFDWGNPEALAEFDYWKRFFRESRP